MSKGHCWKDYRNGKIVEPPAPASNLEPLSKTVQNKKRGRAATVGN